MSLERPENWKPPEINHGGENIPEFFAHLLVDQMVAMICVRLKHWELPIANGMDEITKTKKGY